MTDIKSYTELIQFPTFEERFRYLKLGGHVAEPTFGSKRYLNQRFYTSPEWRQLRSFIITRDMGCDLGVEGHDIFGRVYIHHINPLTVEELITSGDLGLLPEYLITTSFDTHQAIHYGSERMLVHDPVVRTENDTCPWKRTTNEGGDRHGEHSKFR